MIGDGVQFGRVPYWIAPGGKIAKLGRSPLAVYLAIASHVNGREWSAEISLGTRAHETGISRSTAKRAIRRLAACELIEIDRAVGRGNPHRYTLVTHPKRGHSGDPLSDPKRGHSGDTLSEKKQVTQVTPFPREKGSKSTLKGVTQVTPEQREQRKKKKKTAPRPPAAPGAAAAGQQSEGEAEDDHAESIEKKSQLLRAGRVGQPMRRQLAAEPRLSVETVRAIVEAGHRGARVVQRCKDAIDGHDAEAEAAERAAERQRAAEQQQAAEVAEREAELRRRLRAAEIIAEHPRAEVDAAFAKFLNGQPRVAQRTYRARGVEACATFIAELLAPGRLDREGGAP